MRFYKSVSNSPAYTQTSYNAEHRWSRGTFHASLHTKWAWGGGGFWVGLRPEVYMHRQEDKVAARLAEMRNARMQCICWSCGREEWGEPGFGQPAGWEMVSALDFCAECASTKTLQALLSRGEPDA